MGSTRVSDLAPSQPWTQIQPFAPSPRSIHLQKNHIQEIDISAKISWGKLESLHTNHTKNKTKTKKPTYFRLAHYFCAPQTSTLAVPHTFSVQSSEFPAFWKPLVLTCDPSAAPMSLRRCVQSTAHPLTLLLDPSVLPRPNVFMVNETLCVSFCCAFSLTSWLCLYIEYPQFIIYLPYLTPAKRGIVIGFY